MNYSDRVREKLIQGNVDEALEMITNMAQKYFEESGTGEL